MLLMNIKTYKKFINQLQQKYTFKGNSIFKDSNKLGKRKETKARYEILLAKLNGQEIQIDDYIADEMIISHDIYSV